MNTFGTLLRMSLWGESHGRGVGALVDGLPPGLEVSEKRIQVHLDRRRPGFSALASARREEDLVDILSGVFEGRSTGAPVLLHIANRDARPGSYEALASRPRPGHGDLTIAIKARGFQDPRGGGHGSGRLTAGMVAAGALAHGALADLGIEVAAQTARIGEVEAPAGAPFEGRWDNDARSGDADAARRMAEAVRRARREGDSLGGIVRCRVTGLPAGVGEPVFDAVEAVLAHAMMAIPAARGVEFGSGFRAAAMRGSEHNDPIVPGAGGIGTSTNHAGGALGGITNGMPLVFAVAFKPTPSIAKPQRTVDLQAGRAVEIRVGGRHDPCIVPRAVPVVECLTAFALMDLMLRQGATLGGLGPRAPRSGRSVTMRRQRTTGSRGRKRR